MVVCLGLMVTGLLCEPADARKKRKRFVSPIKVEQVKTSPNPFVIGQSPLRLSMMVKVPLSSRASKILEVSALITSPTRKSMSFLSQRLSLEEATQNGLLGFVPVELVWDGKDQYDQLVLDGSYFYEIQAKLMEDKGEGPRTKVVSHRVQGTLEALAYAGEVLPPLPPEPELPEEIEALQQEELAEGDPSTSEEGVGVEEESGLVLEESSGGESAQEHTNEIMEDLEPAEISEEILLKETDFIEPDSDEQKAPAGLSDQNTETISESTLESDSTDLSSPSEANPSQH